MSRRLARALVVTASACLFAVAADAPTAALTPVGVCDILRDLTKMDGKELAVVGRYSFRSEGRWMSEQSCDAPAPTPPELWLQEDARDAPKPPGQFEIDNLALRKKLAEIGRHTSLGKFRFGTPDYDRWAVVY